MPDRDPFRPSTKVAQELMAQIAAGQTESLTTLLHLYRSYIKQWSRSKIPKNLRPRVQSSSVVQETVLRVQMNADKLKGRTLAEFENYLHTTAKNHITSLWRFHSAKRRSILRHTTTDEVGSRAFWENLKDPTKLPSDQAVGEVEGRSAMQQRVELAMLQLPSHYQAVLREHFEKEKSLEQLGKDLDRSPDAVRKLIIRAVAALKRLLELPSDQSSGE